MRGSVCPSGTCVRPEGMYMSWGDGRLTISPSNHRTAAYSIRFSLHLETLRFLFEGATTLLINGHILCISIFELVDRSLFHLSTSNLTYEYRDNEHHRGDDCDDLLNHVVGTAVTRTHLSPIRLGDHHTRTSRLRGGIVHMVLWQESPSEIDCTTAADRDSLQGSQVLSTVDS